MTSTENVRHRLTDVRFGGLGIPIEVRFSSHHDAIDAEAALHRLLINECFLNRVRFVAGPEPFERRDLAAGYRRNRRDAGPHGLTFDDHSTTAALTEPAAELRASQRQVVAENVKQRSRRFGLQTD